MKRLPLSLLCLFVSLTTVVASAEEMDKALKVLADDLAALTKENAKKKITVLDFTDLQGAGSKLGKYIAEELTVDLVMIRKDFSVLDRANLQKILAEHKLTATGLVDPENAKKLGQFAGVDALVLGNIIPKKGKIAITAKIISTDTAEIVGAAKSEFQEDELEKELAAAPVEQASQYPEQPPIKPFGDLDARLESVKLLPGDNVYGFASLSLIISNKSAAKTYGVAVNPEIYSHFNLSNDRGDEFKATEIHGVETAFESGNGRYQGGMTDIPPKSKIRITSKSQVRWQGRPGEYRPYHLQTVILFGEEEKGRHLNIRKYDLFADFN
jgi:TolB-like protein